jgi:hypothetical protein
MTRSRFDSGVVVFESSPKRLPPRCFETPTSDSSHERLGEVLAKC